LAKRLCPIAIDALAFILLDVNRHLFFSGVHAMRGSFFMQHGDPAGDVYWTACELGLRPPMLGSMSVVTHFKPYETFVVRMTDEQPVSLTFRRSSRQFGVNFVASLAGEMRGPPAG
jgi:hypothetical protein